MANIVSAVSDLICCLECLTNILLPQQQCSHLFVQVNVACVTAMPERLCRQNQNLKDAAFGGQNISAHPDVCYPMAWKSLVMTGSNS